MGEDGDRKTAFLRPSMPEGLCSMVSAFCSNVGAVCAVIVGVTLVIGVFALTVWHQLETSDPTCSIQEFYLPALDKSANSTTNTTLYFDLNLYNGNGDKGIYYDALNLKFYYGPDQTHLIGTTNFSGFYQGYYKKNNHRSRLLETHGVPWEAVFRAVSNGTAVFRVDLATSVRFKIVFWNTKRKRLVVGSIVEVNDSGKKVNKKGIILQPDTPESASEHAWKIVGIVFTVFSVFCAILGFLLKHR